MTRRTTITRIKDMTETKIYTASVDCLADPALYQMTLSLLPAQRRESAERMKIWSGKRLSAGAGLLLMAALADRMTASQGTDSDSRGNGFRELRELRSLRFTLGENGKPYLTDYPQVHFNLSHSGNRVMCIVSSSECGCDVEKVERRQKNIESVIRCLAESEQRQAAVSAVSFCRIWTLKESILKLSGKGIVIPLRSFEVSLDPLAVKQDFIDGPVVLKEYGDFRGTGTAAGSQDREDHMAAGGSQDREDHINPAGNGTVPEPDDDHYCCACALAGGKPPEKLTEVDLRKILEECL